MSNQSKDRGAVLVWFAIMTVAFIGMGALVIDVGAMWSERRQLQNGADAAALAVAIGAIQDETTASDTAKEYAKANAKDGLSEVEELCGQWPGVPSDLTDGDPCSVSSYVRENVPNWVYVKLCTQTVEPLSGTCKQRIKFLFAPIINAANVGTTLRASATVGWGVPNGLGVVAMVVGKCAFQDAWVTDGEPSFPILNPDGSQRSPVVELEQALVDTDGVARSCPDPQPSDLVNGWEYSSVQRCASEIYKDPTTAEYRLKNEAQGNSANLCSDIVGMNQPILVAIVSNFVLNRAPNSGCTGNANDVCYYVVQGVATFRFCAHASTGWQVDNQCPSGGSGDSCSIQLNVTRQNAGLFCGYFEPGTVSEGDILNTSDPNSSYFGTKIIKFLS